MEGLDEEKMKEMGFSQEDIDYLKKISEYDPKKEPFQDEEE